MELAYDDSDEFKVEPEESDEEAMMDQESKIASGSHIKHEELITAAIVDIEHIKCEQSNNHLLCEFCDNASANPCNLNMSEKSRNEGILYPCDQCGYSASRLSTLKSHIDDNHEGIRYPCDQCEYSATRLDTLKSHINDDHQGILYSCDQCGYSVSRLEHLKLHIENIHSGFRYTSEQCDIRTATHVIKQENVVEKIEQEISVGDDSTAFFENSTEFKKEETMIEKVDDMAPVREPESEFILGTIDDFITEDTRTSTLNEVKKGNYKIEEENSDVDDYEYYNTELYENSIDIKEEETMFEIVDDMAAVRKSESDSAEQLVTADQKPGSKDQNLNFLTEPRYKMPIIMKKRLTVNIEKLKLTKYLEEEVRVGEVDKIVNTKVRSAIPRKMFENPATQTKKQDIHENIEEEIDSVQENIQLDDGLKVTANIENDKDANTPKQILEKYCDKTATTVHNAKQHSCDQCGFTARRSDKLKLHIENVHKKIRYPCHECDFSATRPDKLKNHKLSKHPVIKYLYDQCEYKAKMSDKLKSRKERKPKKMFACNQCDFTGTSPDKLKLRRKNIHTEIRYSCDYSALKLQKLKSHKGKRHKGYGYPCDHCGYEATRPTYLKKHLESKHGSSCLKEPTTQNLKTKGKSKYQKLKCPKESKYQRMVNRCDQCNYAATSKQSLKKHKKDNHNNYHCDQCEFLTTRLVDLKMHKQSQHGVIPYPCVRCDFSASSAPSLQYHKMSRHENIRYPCDQCNLAATSKQGLRKHKETKHQDNTSRSIVKMKKILRVSIEKLDCKNILNTKSGLVK